MKKGGLQENFNKLFFQQNVILDIDLWILIKLHVRFSSLKFKDN